MKFLFRAARLKAVTILAVVLACQPAFSLNPPCESLLRIENGAQKAGRSALHFTRTFLGGRWRWKTGDVEKILESIPPDAQGRALWINEFRKRAAKGDYTPEEMLAYMQVVSPSAGKDLYTLLTGKDGIWIRRKKFWTPLESRHANKILLKVRRLGTVDKLTFPRKITDLDETLVNLVIVLSQVATPKQGVKPVLASVFDASQWKDIPGWTTEQWDRFGGKIYDQLITLTYAGDPVAQEQAKILFSKTRETLFRDKAAQKEFLLRLIQDVEDPRLLKDVEKNLTADEMKAYKVSGLPGLLDQMIRQNGFFASANQFRKLIADTAAYRVLGLIAGGFFIATFVHHELQAQASAGSGAAVNNVETLNPRGKSITPYLDPDLKQEIEEAYQEGAFSPYMKGLLGPDIVTGRDLHPCDPQLLLEKQIAAREKTEGEDQMKQDGDFTRYLVAMIKRYGDDPATGCYNQYFKLMYDQLANAIESQ